MLLWLLKLGKGLVVGLIGTGVKLSFTKRALGKVGDDHERLSGVLVNCYVLRHALNIALLLLAYFLLGKDVVVLLGVALGLTIPEFILHLRKLF
ncbi:MAG TPA: hypothetical protein GX687_06870 [Clostridia bacterium]|jgi:uncharacterized membrane-anchored protein YitT (DUF2179 family)|nr:hypothetical protein [Clostridia bacterium]